MIIFWKGLGILVAIAGFSGFLAAEVITRSVTKDVTYYRTHPLPKLGGAVLGAALAYGTTKLLEKWNAPRVMVDKKTGKPLIDRGELTGALAVIAHTPPSDPSRIEWKKAGDAILSSAKEEGTADFQSPPKCL